MKKMLSLLLVGTLLLASVSAPAFGGEEVAPSSPLSRQAEVPSSTTTDPPGELIIADVLFLRPVGVAACVVGLAGALLTWPFAATSNSADRVGRQLMIKPFRYTFERPLGQLDWPDSEDDTNL